MQASHMDILLVLGAFAGMLVAFYKVIGSILSQSAKDRESDRTERNALTDAIKDMAKASKQIADATQQGNREAKQRNGHLGEQNVQIAKLVTDQNTDVASIKNSNEAIARILSKSALIAAEDRDLLTGGSPQIIHEQTVENQIIQKQGE